jgi:hypothetical protein
MLFEGIAGRFTKTAGNVAARLTSFMSLAVAQVEPDGDELTRAGLRFHFGPVASVTGIAPVQAIPSTAAQWLLWNPASNKRTIFIDEIGVLLVSGTAGAGVVLLGGKVFGTQAPTTVAQASAADMATDGCGSGNGKSQLVIASGVTLSAAPTALFVAAKDDTANTAILSVAAHNADVRGKIAIPPGTGLALYVCSPAGTSPLFAPFGTYHELDAEIE